jgi:hypothetical protein
MDVTVLATWFNGLLTPLIFIVTLALVDFIGGALTALFAGMFKLEKVGDFAKTLVIWLFAWIAAELLGFLPGFLGVEIQGYKELIAQNAGGAMLGFIVLKYAASILGHIASIKQVPDPAFFAMKKVGIKPTTDKYIDPEPIIEVPREYPHLPGGVG